jgi:hypothetical protein
VGHIQFIWVWGKWITVLFMVSFDNIISPALLNKTLRLATKGNDANLCVMVFLLA